MQTLDYQMVTTADALNGLVKQWLQLSWVALDTEFLREDTYFPIPALIQLYDGQTIYLIDPLTIDNFDALTELLGASSVVKIMHSCSEDLEIFRLLCDVVPRPLFDTQIAAGYSGIGFSMSYQGLVQSVLDVELDKGETRSKWLRRPLTEQQLQYAAHDVRWLPAIYQHISDQLANSDRQKWFDEDMEKLLDEAAGPIADELIYLRIKASSRLSVRALNLLRYLAAWREKTARDKNIPKGRVLSDAALMTIADSFYGRAASKEKLAGIRELTAKQVRNYGDDLLQLVAQHLSDSPDDYPSPVVSLRAPEFRRQLKAMKVIANQVADEINMPVEILARRKDIESFVVTPNESNIASSWRRPFLFDKFSDVVQD